MRPNYPIGCVGAVFAMLLAPTMAAGDGVPVTEHDRLTAAQRAALEGRSVQGPAQAGGTGPDVIVLRLGAQTTTQVGKWGTVGDITGYSFHTTSCNIGDTEAQWVDCEDGEDPTCNDHPVIAQNLYRLRDGRFEQIGMAWLKHGFCAVNESGCGDCQNTPCDTLGLECADTYSAQLNGGAFGGVTHNLGPRSEINAATGAFPYPYILGWDQQTGNDIFKRLQVHNADLDPSLNAGARYFAEAHYVTADDAAAGNDDNNASHREVVVGDLDEGGWELDFSGDVIEQQPAIAAWFNSDPDVGMAHVDIADDGRMTLAYKVTEIGDDLWHYEYALYNMNSDRSAQAFSVPVPGGVKVTNVGFHDVDYHSGEPFSAADWSHELSDGMLTWRTDAFEQDPNANALRWGTLYNFRFDADAPPLDMPRNLVVGLFKPAPGDAAGPSDSVAVPLALAAPSAPAGPVGAVPMGNRGSVIGLGLIILTAAVTALAARKPLPGKTS